jgi:hypothetical protein
MEAFSKYRTYIFIGIALAVLTVTIVPPAVILTRSSDSSPSSSPNSNVTDGQIDIPDDMTNDTLLLTTDNWINETTWNMFNYYYGKDNWKNIDRKTFEVTYQAGTFNPSSTSPGGFLFYARPQIFPTDEVYLSYQIKFGDNGTDFNWVKGGMLPGVWIGQLGAYDGRKPDNGSSARVMWRSNGMAEAYLYVDPQESAFYTLPGYYDNAPFGHSIYRGFGVFEAMTWNSVIMYIKLNTVDQYDGVLSLNINNRVFTFTSMKWRNSEAELINGIMMHSFFGGSDITWATPAEQHIYFTNMTVYV